MLLLRHSCNAHCISLLKFRDICALYRTPSPFKSALWFVIFFLFNTSASHDEVLPQKSKINYLYDLQWQIRYIFMSDIIIILKYNFSKSVKIAILFAVLLVISNIARYVYTYVLRKILLYDQNFYRNAHFFMVPERKHARAKSVCFILVSWTYRKKRRNLFFIYICINYTLFII